MAAFAGDSAWTMSQFPPISRDYRSGKTHLIFIDHDLAGMSIKTRTSVYAMYMQYYRRVVCTILFVVVMHNLTI